MHLAHYLGLLHRSQCELAEAFRAVAATHSDEADVARQCERLARQCDAHAEQLEPITARYGEGEPAEPDLIADLHDLYRQACHCDMAWTLLGQAAQGARDRELLEVVQGCEGETEIQLKWLRTRMKQAAPQALVVA
jgi:DNA-binding transcriptional regulator YbjK